MPKIEKIEWKESLIKSIVYRSITIILGFLTALVATGNIALAFGVALLTEFVQAINYFFFELAWSNLITRKRLEKEILQTINLELNFDSILELAYEMSRIDTFVEKIYKSNLNFFNSVLQNETLKDLHDKISQYDEYFKKQHEGRDFPLE